VLACITNFARHSTFREWLLEVLQLRRVKIASRERIGRLQFCLRHLVAFGPSLSFDFVGADLSHDEAEPRMDEDSSMYFC
jgi:hypothetical protein